MLVKYKSDLSRPFDEATTFLNKIETQLSNLCTGASIQSLFDHTLSYFFIILKILLIFVLKGWHYMRHLL
jgi:hypothetical protein